MSISFSVRIMRESGGPFCDVKVSAERPGVFGNDWVSAVTDDDGWATFENFGNSVVESISVYTFSNGVQEASDRMEIEDGDRYSFTVED